MKTQTIINRERFSRKRLRQLKAKVKKIGKIGNLKQLCIYVTGSYGRIEASPFSDLDLFFIDLNEKKPLPRLTKISLDSELIKITRRMKFPEFSGDGEYLQTHLLKEIKDQLGSPIDDYKNFFTARLLLILESYPIFNERAYEKTIKILLQRYYKDFHDHTRDFKPVFLANDILRYWKTLCLNYEHKRNRENLDNTRKADVHIKNLKLKFSRKLTCFSLLLQLLAKPKVVSPKYVMEIIKTPPIQRLINLLNNTNIQVREEIKPSIRNCVQLYSDFLDFTNCSKKTLVKKIKNRNTRERIFGEAAEFGRNLYNIMKTLDNSDLLMYFII